MGSAAGAAAFILKDVGPDDLVTIIRRVAVGEFLDDSDLVKFAKFTPGPEDCTQILGRAETIVRSTMPRGPEARS